MKFINSVVKFIDSISQSLFGRGVQNLFKKFTSAGMTDAQREAADYELGMQRELNEEEYQRKIDFYERYESPQAQVNQYKNAGLNPALMYGYGASVSASGGIGSAGSASVPSESGESVSSLLSVLVGAALQNKQLGQQKDLRNRELDLKDRELELYGTLVGSQSRNIDARTVYQNTVNMYEDSFRKWTVENLKDTSSELKSRLKNYEVQRLLGLSQVARNDAETSMLMVQERIARIDEKYRSRIAAAQARVSELQASLLATQDKFQAQLLQSELNIAAQQVTSLILSNGISAKDFGYYDSNRKFSRWTTGISTGVKALGAIGAVGVGLAKFTPIGVAASGLQSMSNSLAPSRPVQAYDYDIPPLMY